MQIHKRTIGRKYKLKPNLFSFCFSLCPHTTDLLVELLSCLLRSALPFHHLRPSLEIQGYVSAYYPNKANSMQNINLLVATIIQEKLPNFQLFCLPLEVLNRLLKFRISSIFVMPQNKITTPKKKKVKKLVFHPLQNENIISSFKIPVSFAFNFLGELIEDTEPSITRVPISR